MWLHQACHKDAAVNIYCSDGFCVNMDQLKLFIELIKHKLKSKVKVNSFKLLDG